MGNSGEGRRRNGANPSVEASSSLTFYKVEYIYRNVPQTNSSPMLVGLQDGDEIKFGEGPDGALLGQGPHPLLCNLHLAIARMLKMSGATDVIAQWKHDANDGDFPHVYLASEEFCKMLDAQLLLSGRTLVA
jgi:hypothetical protein